MNLEERLGKLVASYEDRMPSSAIGAARNDIGYGEYGLAFENFCEHLFDSSLELSQHDFAQIAELAEIMSIPERRWKFLSSRVVPGRMGDESE